MHIFQSAITKMQQSKQILHQVEEYTMTSLPMQLFNSIVDYQLAKLKIH